MSPPSTQSSKSSAARGASGAWRVRFITGEAPGSSRVLQQFKDPSAARAIVESVSGDDWKTAPTWPEQWELLDVRIGAPADAENWLMPPSQPDAPLPVSLRFDGGRISWRPARAIVEGDAAWADEALPVLAEFAFYEGELRKLEAALPAYEIRAASDAAFAYQPADKHQGQWERLGKTMEELALLRLAFARLEPRLLNRSPAHSPGHRKIFARLCRAAAVEDRLEAVTNRMEACEDLYEGGVDRIRDHRWYRKGNLLETAIVVLLVIEVIQIAAELGLRIFAGR